MDVGSSDILPSALLRDPPLYPESLASFARSLPRGRWIDAKTLPVTSSPSVPSSIFSLPSPPFCARGPRLPIMPLRETRTTGVARCAARDPNTSVETRARTRQLLSRVSKVFSSFLSHCLPHIPQPRTIPLPRVVRSGHKGPTLTSTSNLPSIRSPHLSSRPSFPFRQWRTPLRATRTTGVSRCAARDPNTFVERRAHFPPTHHSVARAGQLGRKNLNLNFPLSLTCSPPFSPTLHHVRAQARLSCVSPNIPSPHPLPTI